MIRPRIIAWLLTAVVLLGSALTWILQVAGEPPVESAAGLPAVSGVAPHDGGAEVPQTSGARSAVPKVGAGAVDRSTRSGLSLTGRVIDETTRRPIAGADVSFRYVGTRRPAGEKAQTGGDGWFTMSNLPSERIVLQVSAKDYAPAERGVTPPASELEIVLSRGGLIAGQVLSADGSAAVPGSVELWNMTTNSGDRADTRDDGQFQIPNLNPGRYRISARTRVGHTAPVDVLLGSNERAEGLMLKVLPGRVIRGSVSGLPPADLAQVQIGANSVEYEGEMNAPVSTSGAFRIEGVRPGLVQVVANAPNGRSIGKMIEMTAAADATVDLRFEEGVRLSGRVTRRGRPVEGTLVIATHLGAYELSASARTSSTGEYAIDGLAAGEEHEVSADHRTIGKIRIFEGWVFDIELGDDGLIALAGRVISTNGTPLPGALVMLQRTDGGLGVRSNGAGEFSVNLQPGDVDVIAYKPGYALLRQSLRLDNPVGDLTLRLRQAPGVEVRARDAATGTPLRELHVLAGAPGTRGRPTHFRIELDERGMGSLPSEFAGHGLLLASSEYASIQFDSWSGQPLDLAFELPPESARQ